MTRFQLTAAVIALVMASLATAQEEQALAPEDLPAPQAVEAEGTQGQSASGSEVIYIPLKPAFVVNYGGPGRLKYLKADVSVRLNNVNAANSVRHHMPYLRNNLLMLFSAQTEESLHSQEGKEALRQEALREVRELLLAEDQQAGVVDLYFNSLIVQN